MDSTKPEKVICEKHDTAYVPGRVPCPGCRLEAEAHDRLTEDYNLRASLGMLSE